MNEQVIAASVWRPLAAARLRSLFVARAALLLLGVLSAYAIGLLPVARGQYDAVGGAIHAFFIVGLFITAIIALADHLTRICFRTRPPFDLGDAAWYAVAVILTGFTIPVYGIFKQLVLPARGFPLDPYLAALDRTLFFGHAPWTVTHAVLGSVVPTAAIDTLYASWMALMFLFPALAVALVRSQQRRTRLLLCWMLIWMVVGSAAAWLFASAGPIFYESAVAPNASFHALTTRLAELARQAHAMGLPMGEPKFRPVLLNALRTGQYATAGGVSAMPSVHVTMAALFAIAGFQVGRFLGWTMTVLAVVIWIGSIHLGWHYATDGIVGTAMILMLWRLSDPVVRWATGGSACAAE